MDAKIMELRLQQWMPIFKEQAKSGLNKQEWCTQNGVKRTAFFKWQRECRKYLLEKNTQTKIPNQNTSVPVICEPTFIEIPKNRSTTLTPTSQAGHDYVLNDFLPVSSVNINYGGFSIALTGMIDEKQLSVVLKAVTNVN